MTPEEPHLGVKLGRNGAEFSIWSSAAENIYLCLFDDETESDRIRMERVDDCVFRLKVRGLGVGARYGLRADGNYDPDRGLWFDPTKLLLDPYALRIDRPFAWRPELSSRRCGEEDTAPFSPKAVIENKRNKIPTLGKPLRAERLIYELQVRSFSIRHPDVPPEERGKLSALANPAIIEHLKSLGVGAVELMPITAWIDERHLTASGLTNAWGYNPVSYFALDPRLAPGGIDDLRKATKALHAADIAVILDVVYNHNGESDFDGSTLSFRGLDPLAYFQHTRNYPVQLINDTGCGNTLRCQSAVMRRLVRDSMRYFVEQGGVDGFRFDLAPVLGRTETGYSADAPLIRDLLEDPILKERILIAEPWDIGPGGYQLGAFPETFLEWNDRYRDDVRRFWRGDAHASAALATRLAGSSDIFEHEAGGATRSVNFIAAHDGFALADIVAYETRHNEANNEGNRDGHSENFSWNHGTEGASEDPDVNARRRRDIKALLATLFVSRGFIMMTAGDEFGRSQGGNNNAYAQDNEMTWLDWEGRDLELQQYVVELARMRETSNAFSSRDFFSSDDIRWRLPNGQEKQTEDWAAPDVDAFALAWRDGRLALLINRSSQNVDFQLGDGAVTCVPARSIIVD